ncbi:MAG: EscU/YscU/HrcU family type III secretion system export apparatus switch protein [Burkholderiaceae bacterium]|jgi:flagellar biosynthesis protein
MNPSDPRRSAAALSYGQADKAPRVVAKGYGLVADQIIARAREHGVFLHESREMVALLMQVDLDRDIPPALYRAVAELLAWLYRLEKSRQPYTDQPPDGPE